MGVEDKIQLRRQLLDWRDKHVDNIQHHLTRELGLLYDDIGKAFKEMDLIDIFNSEVFFKKRIEPICLKWIENESSVLLNTAQDDLNRIFHYKIENNKSQDKINHQGDNDVYLDTATALISTGTAVAAIPTLMTLSTASAGGILGLLGVTTTVISWPVVIVGGSVLLGLSHFGIGKAGSLKSDAIKRLRKQTEKSIRERVIQNKKGDTVCQRLQLKISDTAGALIRELEL